MRIRMHARPSAALCRRCRAIGRACWRLGGWRRCIHPPVAPSLSFWCPPLSVRGAPHQPGEPYRQAAATGHWHRIPLPRPGGSGAHQLIPCADGCCQGTGAGPSFPESDGGGLRCAWSLKPQNSQPPRPSARMHGCPCKPTLLLHEQAWNPKRESSEAEASWRRVQLG